MKTKQVATSSLKAHPGNYRAHPAKQLKHLAASIRAHGVIRPVVVAEDGATILAGHGLVEAARLEGIERVPVLVMPYAADSPQARHLIVADNEPFNLGHADPQSLLDLLAVLKEADMLGGTGLDAWPPDWQEALAPATEEKPAADGQPTGAQAQDGAAKPYAATVTFDTQEARDAFLRTVVGVEPPAGARTAKVAWPGSTGAPLAPAAPAKFTWLDSPVKDGRRVFLDLAVAAGARRDFVEAQCDEALARSAGGEKPTDLERRWYERAHTSDPWFGMYDEEGYLGEVWCCWVDYSRKHIRNLRGSAAAMAAIGKPSSVVDLGCGFGASTAALKELFPGASVYGTNVGDAPQARVARALGDKHGFTVLPAIADVPGNVDVVFASEYFEHFKAPLEHLETVLARSPRVVITANTFGAPGAGHFPTYLVNGSEVTGREASRAFNARMRQEFAAAKAGMWNSRPTLWVRGHSGADEL